MRAAPRPPLWLRRLVSVGSPEVAAASVLFAYSLAFSERTGPVSLIQEASSLLVCLGAALCGRWPLAGGITTGIGLTAMLSYTESVPVAIFASLIAVLSVTARGHTRLRAVLTLWYLCMACAVTVPMSHDPQEAMQTVALWVLLSTLAVGVGLAIDRLRRDNMRKDHLRVESLRSQRRAIARDLHDTVAYATTTMIMRAEQIRLRHPDEPQLAEDLDFIITTGRRSVRDLRGMLEALRRNDPGFDDPPHDSGWRIETISEVLEARRAVLAAHALRLDVRADDAVDTLPEAVREALGKLIVEATSNMVKHASGNPCRALIEVQDVSVEAVFTNPVADGAAGPTHSSGLGLLGAAERVEALGGEIEAQQASGTWILRAQLPLGGE